MELNVGTCIAAVGNLLFWIAIIVAVVVVVIQTKRRQEKIMRCFHCKKTIPKEAVVCPYCGKKQQ